MNRSGGGGGGVVEQIMSGGNPNCWNSSISPPDFMPYSSTTSSSSSYTNFLLNPPPPYAPHPPPPAPSLHPLFTSNWHGGHEHEHHNNNTNPELPDSWTHLIMSGAVGEEENGRGGIWQQHASDVDDVKQESSEKTSYVYGDDGSAGKPNWSHHQMLLLPPTNNAISSSPPKSSSSLTLATSILDFSNSHTQATPPPPPPPPSAECNSNTGGGAPKKARVQQSSSSSTFKVRKEKLGDRIAALHQLVSPFGKTDTASVLLEAIGYIRFLQSQIEALSLPYLANNNGSPITIKHHHPVQGEKNCLFPEDPGQLLNENCLKKRKAATQQEGCQHEEEGKKDLRSRGLCLVPVSCTLQVGSDNGADYWAPGFGTGGFR